MSSYTINAQARTDLGKGASRRLRREEGTIPAIIFGGNKEPQPLTLEHKELVKQLEDEAFYSSILTVNIDGTEEKAVLKDLQRHPAKNLVLHADFQRVTEGEKIKMSVPLHFINESKCAAVKLGGKVTHMASLVEVICTPETLPKYLEVDMQNAEVDQIVHLSDVTVPEGVEIAALRLGADYNQAVANVARKRGS